MTWHSVRYCAVGNRDDRREKDADCVCVICIPCNFDCVSYGQIIEACMVAVHGVLMFKSKMRVLSTSEKRLTSANIVND